MIRQRERIVVSDRTWMFILVAIWLGILAVDSICPSFLHKDSPGEYTSGENAPK